MKEELERLVSKYIQLDYSRVLRHIEIDIFKHSPMMYGVSPEDVIQSAVVKMLEFVQKGPDSLLKFLSDEVKEIESENLRGYVFNGLKNNATNVIYDARRRHLSSQNAGSPEMMPHVAGVYGRFESHGDVEHRDLLGNISPGFVGFLKSIDNGDVVLETVRKVGLHSVRGFYIVKENLERDLTSAGMDVNNKV